MNLPWRAKVFVFSLITLSLVSLIYAGFALSAPTTSQLALFSIFILLAVLSGIYATRIPLYRWEISSSITIYLASIFILGLPFTVLLVFIASLSSELFLRRARFKKGWSNFIIPVSFNISQLVITVTVTGLIFRLSGDPAFLVHEASHYLWAILASFSYLLLNLSLVAGIVSMTERKGFLYSVWKGLWEFSIQYLAMCTLALLFTVLFSLSIWHVSLALIPLILVHVSFRSYLKIQTEARKTFEKIARLLDERDHYTAVHSTAVAELAVKVAQKMGLSQGEIEKVDIAARVHDIGKIAVPDSILLKPGPLSKEEWTVMKRHPVVSAELIEGLAIYTPVANAVRHEHEHWNGSGYPDGLKGEEIPLIARIIAAADVHNALTTDRPYRKALSHEKTIEIIKEMRGTDLDPVIADALLQVIASKEE